ncbi:MAG: phosphoribosylformylglycinamidine synthase [Mariprofundaceae bacterium]
MWRFKFLSHRVRLMTSHILETSFFILQGKSALSDFRNSKLCAELQVESIEATHIYIAEVDMHWRDADRVQLADVLNCEADIVDLSASDDLFIVTPRMGTISPWSSKATDILQLCGLQGVKRIERAIVYRIQGLDKDNLSPLHDKMTESLLLQPSDLKNLFSHHQAQPFITIDMMQYGCSVLREANVEMGLALSDDEVNYLYASFRKLERNPSDVELMMFAQANSEHCRHKIFNAAWVIDGEKKDHSLFSMIKHTHQTHPEGTLVAYSDNSSVIEGGGSHRFYPDTNGMYADHKNQTHILMKVETHNHPTAISPFAGAATGSGGEIRDEGATGIGSKPKAGLCGFSVSNLKIPGFEQPWEIDYGKPERIASPLQIMMDGPIGAAAFNNEFGRPNICGYFRTYEQDVAGELRGYHKPIMIAGGVGNIDARHVFKQPVPEGSLIIQLGGPAMLIGLGGGAASSMDTGANTESLDFDSVQRGNPEMERRCQEVLDRCWQMGDHNPILFIHDIGAGGLSNAVPELIHDAGRGGWFDLRKIHNMEPGMSPMQVWCNEAQERYVLAIAPESSEHFSQLCERERCPFAVLGTATNQNQLILNDPLFKNNPVDMSLDVLLGKPPKVLRDVHHRPTLSTELNLADIDLQEAIQRVLHLPAVASKEFLITIADRSITGLVARDQMVGRYQVPVADVAVTASDFNHHTGEAMSMGERTPVAVINAAASGRMAIGEALTNIAAASIDKIGDIKLSANWMAACGHGGEDAALYDTVKAVGLELCPALGISIPVGKDSLSMKSIWKQGDKDVEMFSPLSLIISAFAPVTDIRRTLTPELRSDKGATDLILIDLGEGKCRMGGSALAQVYRKSGVDAPDIDHPARFTKFFTAIQQLNAESLLCAYHDRSDGGLFVTLVEMAFAGHTGISIDLDTLPSKQENSLALLFAEELGAVIQIRKTDRDRVNTILNEAGLDDICHTIGSLNDKQRVIISHQQRILVDESRLQLQQCWSETSYRMTGLRDNPTCSEEAFQAIKNDGGLFSALTFDPAEDVSAPFLHVQRPRVAILREQGVNGQIEMAASFHKAGFETVDLHMSDILSGKHTLDDFQGLAACGGFSFGDVLGAGRGWANSIRFNPRAHDQFSSFFHRNDVFALGVCNGCQMMSQLKFMIPGAAHWPTFERNQSEQFEARLLMVEVLASSSILMRDMQGSKLPLVIANGEGRAQFSSEADQKNTHTVLRYLGNDGNTADQYPYNPNGSPDAATGFCNDDGRFNIMMPHPERLFRTSQYSWHPDAWGENGPWLRMFQNARRWVG